jgi:hypothetical protein
MIISISLPIILACLRVAFSQRSRLFKERLDFFTNYAADELFRIIYCQQGRQTYNSMSHFFFTSSSQYRELIIRLFTCMQYHIFAKFMCTIIPNKLLMIYDIGVCFFCWVFRRESIVDVSFNGKVPACSCFDKHVLRFADQDWSIGSLYLLYLCSFMSNSSLTFLLFQIKVEGLGKGSLWNKGQI